MQALLRAQEKEARREEAARLRAEEEAEKEAARKKLNGKEGRDGKMATEGEDVTAGGDGQKRVSRALSESASSRSSYSPSTKEAMARELEAKKREELRLYLGESREAFYGGPPKPGQDGEEAREDVAAVHAAPSVQGSQGGRTQSESIALSEGDYYSDYYYSDTASSADATPPRQQTRGLAAAAPQAAADPETGARVLARQVVVSMNPITGGESAGSRGLPNPPRRVRKQWRLRSGCCGGPVLSDSEVGAVAQTVRSRL